MLELLGVAAAIGASVFAHRKTRTFVARRLRYTDWIEKSGLGLVVGAAGALAAAPVVALLPVVGAGSALIFGVGVGSGASRGARDARRSLLTR